MTQPDPEASDGDLAEQSRLADPQDDAGGDDEFSAPAEADTADLLEQQQSVPLPDDDYDR